MTEDQTNTAKALLKSFLPSLLSAFVGLCLATSIMVVHVISLSLNAGLLLPNLLQGETEIWGTLLVNGLEPTVLFVAHNTIAATSLIALMWGVVGVLLYLLMSSTIAAAKEAYNIKDPTMRFYLVLLAWHVVIAMLMVALTFALWPVAKWLISQDYALAQSATVPELLAHIGTIVLGWMLILHAYVVLYRLFRHFYIS